MLYGVGSINFRPQCKKIEQPNTNYYSNSTLLRQPETDIVSFTGKSMPSMYNTVFEYLAAEVLGRNSKKFHVDGSMLSASKIKDAVNDLLKNNSENIFGSFKRSQVDKIKWKSYIPADVRTFSIDKINKAREVRIKQWRDFLENPSLISETGKLHNPELVEKIKEDKSIKLVVWDAITSEIKDNNRHIPVPFNEKALLETINRFENFAPKDRAVSCAKPSFLEIYTHRLRDNLLMDLNLSAEDAVWVKVPSFKHDNANKEKNIEMLEILSCKNWCTRSSVDKAQDALTDGDFYIYLKRNSLNLWEPLVGMTTSNGKIDQIQGVENNNIVPLNLVKEIKAYINNKGLKCHSGLVDEGPKAHQAILISEKLNEVDDVLKKSFAKSIKDNDDSAMFKYLGVDTKMTPDGKLEISTYRPSYTLNANSGITIPYSMFGLDEDDLLRNVKTINGNFVLYNKNSLFNSRIKMFPPNLEKVTGKVLCSAEQYERFGEDIRRVVDGNLKKIHITNN